VVDDGEVPVEDLCAGRDSVRYVRLEGRHETGSKLNIGVEHARGSILHKLDDDDYYSPDFLATSIRFLPGDRRSAPVPCGTVMSTLNPLRKGSATIHASCRRGHVPPGSDNRRLDALASSRRDFLHIEDRDGHAPFRRSRPLKAQRRRA
jgi:hypothetical protein